jgi:hypothetical protein
LLRGEFGKPRIVEHDQIVGAGARVQVDQLLLKEIGVRKLSDVYMDAGLGFVVQRRLLQRVAFHAGVDRQREAIRVGITRALTAPQADYKSEQRCDSNY